MAHCYDEEGGRSVPVNAGAKKALVFLIGDSIQLGFLPYARAALAGEAELVAPDENCRYTQYTYTNLADWRGLFADPGQVRLIHWNNGHWDVAHWDADPDSLNSPGQYAGMLVRIFYRLRRYFPAAKIIFATTSPANPNGIMGPNPRTNEEIDLYNQAARSALEPLGVQINDINAFVKGMDESLFLDYVHLTEEGFARLGEDVAGVIRAALKG